MSELSVHNKVTILPSFSNTVYNPPNLLFHISLSCLTWCNREVKHDCPDHYHDSGLPWGWPFPSGSEEILQAEAQLLDINLEGFTIATDHVCARILLGQAVVWTIKKSGKILGSCKQEVTKTVVNITKNTIS